MILVQSVSKSFYSSPLLKNLSFCIEKGEIIGLLGPNGSGKTTLLRLLATLLEPETGEIYFDGLNLKTEGFKVRRRLGYLAEHHPLYPEMKVSEYLSFRAHLKGIPPRRISEKLLDVIELTLLKEVQQTLISTLSRGYAQRVALADALINEPDLLLLDDPFLGLDQEQQSTFFALLKRLSTRHTLIMATHNLTEAAKVCSRFLVLKEGNLLFLGEPKEYLNFLEKKKEVAL